MIKVGQKYKWKGCQGRYFTKDKEYVLLSVKDDEAVILDDTGSRQVICYVTSNENWQLVPEPISIYLAHPISNTYEAEASIQTALLLRDKGFTVYAAAENASINDKSNNPIPRDIFKADYDKIKECDTFIVNITGGMQDGTLFEVGYAAALGKRIIAYSTNTRLANPQHWNGIPSASANHLVLGAIDKWCNNLEEVLHALQS